ncbi:Acyl transferase/acyl hydrolase/lysophospholipase [Penicillium griseofulvum]|uniref:Acyl transferase/acyl hydrolase/lysophospholipase n=1 Tax=Penicillium patulum TaxID=5078 RepID=A0A135LEB1_PENPA|nr:Acyl transferase/acyl hydrolase/lysophospholipase [Penicillium griseofulvum]KXG47306.1 Acyl transferase/acyl hydrolase/lysophospholipase [Penicillium griseofulvum]
MAGHLKLYLFGDQTYDLQTHLKDLLQKRNNPVVEHFLVRSYDAVRAEIFKLPPSIREAYPRFTCVDDLIMWNQNGERLVPLDMAVTSIYQLGMFISQSDPGDFFAGKALVLGLCTGSLAAAAVACSHSVVDLVPLAVSAVVASFKTGVLVNEVAHRVASPQESDQSWSVLIPGSKSSEAIHEFCAQTAMPLTSKPYISAYSPNGITVSGPPKSLAHLKQSKQGKDLIFKEIPIYAPYHASHLYSMLDVADVIGDLASEEVSQCLEQVPVFSSTGEKSSSRNFGSLLESAVKQILLQTINWSDVLGELQAYLQSAAPQSFSVVPIGSTAHQLIYTALKQTSLRTLVPSSQSQDASPSAPIDFNGSQEKSKLAIIAMSGRFPGAKDNEAFWDVLYQGLDMHKPVPASHWDVNTHVDPTGKTKNTSASPFGCWLDDPAGFDARFFNISPREAPQIDPAQRLALMTAYEAIEQAGLVPDATPSTRRDRVGVFYGVTSNDWMETNSAQNIDTYFIPGGNRAFIPGRINYCFKFSGPSYAVDTACSSSLAGIHLACNSLWRGDIDTAIAGGTNVLTNPDFTSGLDRGHFLSRTGNCKTFDDDADGYCRGEGIGTVIIKRLDDAIADKDPILGVILGASTNHSAESESITRPHSGAQRAIFKKILNQAAVDPYSVSYVEMHGTGTQAGDAGEMTSVLDTFAPALSEVPKGRTEEQALYLGSAKANIGHGEAASGVSALIKVLLMMQKNMIVPHCGIKTKINSKFPTDLKERNVNIALKPTAWERGTDASKPRRVFVNNFSAAGGNSALLIEDAPVRNKLPITNLDPKTVHLVAVSAKAGNSLQGNLRSLLAYLKQNPEVPLGELSYTTTARRMHHKHRVMLAGSNMTNICTQIETALRDSLGMTRPKNAPKVVFTFTGQGAQYPGMGKDLCKTFSLFRTEIARLDQIAQSLGFPSFLPVIQSDEPDIGTFDPTAVQLASVCMQIALSKLWASWDIFPTAVVGHSLGEYAALNVAGVLLDAETIYLVGKRAEMLQEKCTRDTHSMLVVRGSVEQITEVLKDQDYETACINSPVETVLAGTKEKVLTLKEILTDAGMKSTLLKVPYAFHSSQIDPIMADFADVAKGVTFFKPKIPVLCPLEGTVATENEFTPLYLALHARKSVNMFKALQAGYSSDLLTEQTITIEIGPHPAISGMVKAVLGSQMITLASAQRAHSVSQVLTTALKTLYTAGADINWAGYQRDFKCFHNVLRMPAYSWDLKEFWLQYVNDWSLRKGDPPTTITAGPSLESTTIHRIVEESGNSAKTMIIVEADIARKDLSPLVQGHEVDGIPLCTPSVYADIALTLGTYLIKRYHPAQEDNLVDVSDMTISKALILKNGATEQLLQAHGEADWASQSALVKFMSFDSKGKLQEHARCVIRFKDRSLQESLQNAAGEVKAKMQALRDGIARETAARFNRPMVYRAIRPLARFHDDYRAIDEVVLNSTTLEASSRLSYGTVKRGGQYHTHPAIIDSLTQSCGFTMNCNDRTDLDNEVFMNHGWGSLQLFEPIDFDKSYTTYTRMEEGKDKLWHGDVVIFDGDKVVAFFGQISIQGVPRRVLKVILSLESGAKSQKPQQPANAKPASTPAPAPIVASTPAPQASQFLAALVIIADESGLSVDDLTDGTVFGDVGIDSLLGLTISARFKEELDLDLDFNAFFFEYPTVGDLKRMLGGSSSGSIIYHAPSSTVSSDAGMDTPDSIGTGATTPILCESKVDIKRALEIISEESGVAMDDLTDDTNFADSGVDSLLSLVIVSRFREELDLDIQHESLFLECPTVADLRQLLVGDVTVNEPVEVKSSASVPAIQQIIEPNFKDEHPALDPIAQAVRRKAVTDYVDKYTAGFSLPTPSPSAIAPLANEKVVLVTGASGSLGSNLVYHLAQLPDVSKIVCLNRENRAEPEDRQQKAMRGKGIRFPEALKHKLVVIQTDSAKPMLGLAKSQYDNLAGSVTHLIHQAWPMSAKRALSGFESQFQVMRNLIDFACDSSSLRPASFKFSFQMVSSVGVVGHYRLGDKTERIMVPEESVDIDSVLTNGYGEAKWGCELMLNRTIQQHPDQFRTMIVRLGQIAGSSTSGYWNPMEHFGFLIKSSQTLNALPDAPGTVFWTSVNEIAGTLSDLVLAENNPYPIYHIENPVGQPWKEVNAILADALGIKNLIPFEEWVARVKAAPQRNNPASTLLEFLDSNYLRMSCGGLVLDVKNTLEHSKTLAAVGPVSEEVVRKYIHIWKEIGFLSS